MSPPFEILYEIKYLHLVIKVDASRDDSYSKIIQYEVRRNKRVKLDFLYVDREIILDLEMYWMKCFETSRAERPTRYEPAWCHCVQKFDSGK